MIKLIGVDWGSTSVRAFAIAADGTVHDTRRADDGVFAGTGDYADRLRALLGDWNERWPEALILLCGMVGSDRGWQLAPYVPAPADGRAIADALINVSFDRPAYIVPGISFAEGRARDVMRGEETLLLGLSVRHPNAVICLPGTHSKWAKLEDARIMRFRTHMTGELRARMLAQGALATDAPQEFSRDAFRAGLAAAAQGATFGLFQARARRLLGTLEAAHMAAFVSGVLIGDEIASETLIGNLRGPVVLAADGPMAEAYGEALADAGVIFAPPEPLAARGLHAIARVAGLVTD
jgi:2-dehydro-3-deoxygalactonokinase